MKKLVLGACGIVGSHVALQLVKAGEQVRAAKRPATSTERLERLFAIYGERALAAQLEWVDVELEDPYSIEAALDGCDAVYHCAGYVSFRSSEREKLFRINEGGTRHVVNACLYKGGVVLCYVSSVATIHNEDLRRKMTEQVFWKKSGHESYYAISKYNAEREVWRGMEEGLKAVIVNPGVILSAGFDNQSSSRMFTTCRKGNLFYPPGTTAYIYAGDLARIMLELTRRELFGERYIVIEGNYSYQAIFSRVQQNFGRRPPLIKAGKWLLRAGWLVERALSLFGREPALTRSLIRSALNNQQFDGSKVVETLSIQLTPVMEALDTICEQITHENA
jgi:nucleoside-diphosphate-sugar epimerase